MSKKLNKEKDEDIIVPAYCDICMFEGIKCKYPDRKIIGCEYGRPTQQAIQWAFKYVNYMTNDRLKAEGSDVK